MPRCAMSDLSDEWVNCLNTWYSQQVSLCTGKRAPQARYKLVIAFAHWATHNGLTRPNMVVSDDIDRWVSSVPTPQTQATRRKAIRSFYSWATLTGITRENIATVARLSPMPPTWQQMIKHYRQWQIQNGKATSTINRQVTSLNCLARSINTLTPWSLTGHQLAQWIEKQGLTPTAQKNYRAAIRSFYTWANAIGYIDDNPGEHLSKIKLENYERRAMGARGPLPKPTPNDWQPMIDAYLAYIRSGGSSKETIRTYGTHLRRFSRVIGGNPLDVTTQDCQKYLAETGKALEYRRSIRVALRSFYSWAEKLELIPVSPAALLPVIKQTPAMPRPASDEDLQRALKRSAPRTRLIIRFAAEMGLRRAEIAQIHAQDIIRTSQGLTLLVHGKGNKKRLVPIPDTLTTICRDLDGYMFPSPQSPTGHITPSHLSKLVSHVLPKGVTLHCLRHRFATHIYALDNDILTTQRLLGHTSPTVTQRYIQTDNAQARTMIQQITIN